MKNLMIFSLLLFYFPVYSSGQSSSTAKRPVIIKQLQKHENSEGQVQIIEDKRIDDFLNKCIDNNMIKKAIPGFRIRIFSQNNIDGGMKHAHEVRSNFIKTFADIESDVVDVIYEQPNCKVYVGYFRTYTDALRMKKQITSLYPDAFIVNINIDYTKF